MRRAVQIWNRPLPLWERAVFVDWHGVLSNHRFWSTVMSHPALRGRLNLDEAVAELFSSSVADEWMRGQFDTRGVIDQFILKRDEPNLARFLEHQVILECERTNPRRRLMGILRGIRQDAMLVLATDNMDCFSTALQRRIDLMKVFDDYLTSAELGVLKAEGAADFFLPWLDASGICIEKSVLIDDRLRNCEAFERLGGSAILFDRSRECWRRIEDLRGPA